MNRAGEFNLLPSRVRDRIASRHMNTRLVRWAVCVAACMGASVAVTAWRARAAESRLASLRDEASAIVLLEEELRTLEANIEATNAQIALQRSVASPIEASRLVHAIAELVPQDAILEHLALRGENLSGEERSKRRRGEAAASRAYQCEVTGVAVDDATIATFVEGLAAREPFIAVNLESSSNRAFQGVEAREFRITFRVDLDEHWTVRTGAMHAQAETEEGVHRE